MSAPVPVVHLRLGDAGLCLDCDALFPLAALACPACASGAVAPLAGFFRARPRPTPASTEVVVGIWSCSAAGPGLGEERLP